MQLHMQRPCVVLCWISMRLCCSSTYSLVSGETEEEGVPAASACAATGTSPVPTSQGHRLAPRETLKTSPSFSLAALSMTYSYLL